MATTDDGSITWKVVAGAMALLILSMGGMILSNLSKGNEAMLAQGVAIANLATSNAVLSTRMDGVEKAVNAQGLLLEQRTANIYDDSDGIRDFGVLQRQLDLLSKRIDSQETRLDNLEDEKP